MLLISHLYAWKMKKSVRQEKTGINRKRKNNTAKKAIDDMKNHPWDWFNDNCSKNCYLLTDKYTDS